MSADDRAEPPSDGRRYGADGRPIRTRDYIRIDPSVFQGALPALAFLIANHYWPAQIAIAVSFAVALVVFVRNKTSGVIRFLSAFGFAIVAVSTAVGLALNSDRAFVAQNIFSDIAFGLIFLGSVFVRRPLIGAIAHELVPGIRPVMEQTNPVFVKLSLLQAAINGISAIARGLMIARLSVSAYVIVSRLVFLPLNIGFIVLCYVAVTRTAIRIWPADMPYEHMRRGASPPSP